VRTLREVVRARELRSGDVLEVDDLLASRHQRWTFVDYVSDRRDEKLDGSVRVPDQRIAVVTSDGLEEVVTEAYKLVRIWKAPRKFEVMYRHTSKTGIRDKDVEFHEHWTFISYCPKSSDPNVFIDVLNSVYGLERVKVTSFDFISVERCPI